MPKCECGCGNEAVKDFLPGHDHTLRIALESRIGGVLQMRSLLDAVEAYAEGKITADTFTQVTRSIFAKAWRR